MSVQTLTVIRFRKTFDICTGWLVNSKKSLNNYYDLQYTMVVRVTCMRKFLTVWALRNKVPKSLRTCI